MTRSIPRTLALACLVVLTGTLATGCIIIGGGGGSGSGSGGGTSGGDTSGGMTGNGSGGDTGTTPTCDSPESLGRHDIESDRTLDGCYVAEDGLKWGEQTVVTLKPGTVLKVGEDSDLLIVRGSLKAEGTAENPVLITGTTKEKGWWKGIQAKEPNPSVEVKHTIVEYGGASGDANFGFGGSGSESTVSIENSTFRHGKGYGISVHNGTIDSFSENTLTKNAEGAAIVDFDDIGVLDAATEYSGNDTDIIRVSRGPITEDTEVAKLGVPFQLDDRAADLKNGANLTIDEGTVFEFDEGGGFGTKGGTLTVEGTSDAKVVFRGTEQKAGWWEGVTIGEDSQKNVLEHLVIADAGKDSSANLQLPLAGGGGSSATLNDVTLKNGSNAGISAHSEKQSTARGCSNLKVVDCAVDARIRDTDKTLSEFKNTICK